MPTELPAGLTLAAIPEREDPRDADWPSAGRSSPRRSHRHWFVCGVQLNFALGVPICRSKTFAAMSIRACGNWTKAATTRIVLAAAGLRRLGLENRITEVFNPGVMCPAVGQGALAVETRDDGGPAFQIAQRLEHPEIRAAVTAERAVLASLGGGCQAPDGFVRVRQRRDALRYRTHHFSGWQQDDPPCQTRSRCRRLCARPRAGRTTTCRGW